MGSFISWSTSWEVSETKAHKGRSKGIDLPSTCKRCLSIHAPLEDHLGRAGTVCNIWLHFIDMTVLAKDIDKVTLCGEMHGLLKCSTRFSLTVEDHMLLQRAAIAFLHKMQVQPFCSSKKILAVSFFPYVHINHTSYDGSNFIRLILLNPLLLEIAHDDVATTVQCFYAFL